MSQYVKYLYYIILVVLLSVHLAGARTHTTTILSANIFISLAVDISEFSVLYQSIPLPELIFSALYSLIISLSDIQSSS